MTRLEEALIRAVEMLDDLGKSYALVGGIAISALAAPRSTGDVDLAVAVADDGEAEAVVRSLAAAGYEIASLLEQDQTNRLAGVRIRDTAGIEARGGGSIINTASISGLRAQSPLGRLADPPPHPPPLTRPQPSSQARTSETPGACHGGIGDTGELNKS